jgi:site-specific DNA-cytosine methylase
MWISGTICVSFSKAGTRRGTNHPVFKLHQRYFQKMCACNNALLIENVPEYSPAVVRSELPATWDLKSCVIDPRIFGLPAARSRIYLVAWDTTKVFWRSEIQIEDIIEALTARDASIFFLEVMPKIRPDSCPSTSAHTFNVYHARMMMMIMTMMMTMMNDDDNDDNE